MDWRQVCEDPNLRNLPYKMELNEWGQIVMSPVKVCHSGFQGEIEFLLRTLMKKGRSVPECAIKTRKGTKVADVAWFSGERWDTVKRETECPIAPEICVEVISGSNSNEEIQEKRKLYFEQGAKEFWSCDQNGRMRFYGPEVQLVKSRMVLDFPDKVEI